MTFKDSHREVNLPWNVKKFKDPKVDNSPWLQRGIDSFET